MNTLEIIDKTLSLEIDGFSGIATNSDYAGTAFRLMDKMWRIIKANGVKTKGLNIWVYEPGEKVFAGIELDGHPESDPGLEHKSIALTKYAYYKHVGPYSQIKQAGTNMRNELKSQSFEIESPYIEIYGHWTNDESKLETELLMALK